MLTITKKLHFF